MLATETVWAMQPAAFSVFAENLEAQASASVLEDGSDSLPYAQDRGIAIIPVEGIVLRQQYWGWGAGLAEIGAALDRALADPQVRAILFNICSPGGTARGVKELSDAIALAKRQKPCAAFVDGLCASAAYWLASATGRIYAGPSAEVGSIGVIKRHLNKSGENEQYGWAFTYITAGSYKALGNPDNPLSEKDLAALQGRVDAIYDMFCGDVAQHMGLALDERLAWADGRDFLAGEAETLGLVTAIVPSRAEAIRQLLKETHMDKTELAQSPQGGGRIRTPEEPATAALKHPDLVAGIQAEAIEAQAAENAKQIDAAVQTAVANTLAIMETACGKESADKIRALVATGMTAQQLAAAALAFGGDSKPSASSEASKREEMLNSIKQATPSAVSADAAKQDEDMAFIKRVGAL